MSKADITFLLNPTAQSAETTATCASPDDVETGVEASSPSMSLFRSLSPIVSSPDAAFTSRWTLPSPHLAPLEKRWSNLHHGSDKGRISMMSMAALCISSDSSSDEMSSGQSTPLAETPRVRKTHAPPCTVDGCKNLSVSRGLCVRHGGGSKCTFPGCIKRAKLNQRCFQHGGFKMCTEPGCTKKAKRYGHCWSHGGGHICEAPGCTKVSTQGGFCWAHGGGNRCKHQSCNRRSYQRYDYYCMRHAKNLPTANC